MTKKIDKNLNSSSFESRHTMASQQISCERKKRRKRRSIFTSSKAKRNKLRKQGSLRKNIENSTQQSDSSSTNTCFLSSCLAPSFHNLQSSIDKSIFKEQDQLVAEENYDYTSINSGFQSAQSIPNYHPPSQSIFIGSTSSSSTPSSKMNEWPVSVPFYPDDDPIIH